MRTRHAASFAALIAIVAANALAMDEYRLDDGVKELGVGIAPPAPAPFDTSLAWLNAFTITPGAETITDMRISFGGGLLANNNIPNGTPVSLFIWGDTNQDGDPSDAYVIDSFPGVITSSGLNTPTTYALPLPLTLTVGERFFAGAIVNYAGDYQVASLDTDGNDDVILYPPNLHSWIAGSNNGVVVDPTNLAGAQLPVAPTAVAPGLGIDGNWMIRLNAIPAPPPMALLGAPLLLATTRRRR